LGGIGLRDEGWNRTQEMWISTLNEYFNGETPENFELHAHELLSPNGNGPFEGDPIQDRLNLANNALELLANRRHSIHYFAIKKETVSISNCTSELPFNTNIPYLIAYDYLVTYLNDHVRNRLGQSARGMVIFDNKDQFHDDIEIITRNRRFEGARINRVKWLVEFSYSVDSQKNPMVQLSDLVVLCIRRFLELENNYRETWPNNVKNFYGASYHLINDRIARKSLLQRRGRGLESYNQYLGQIRCVPRRNWRQYYPL